jgi:DUF4097 and DUF4098 domain-containing protein YvlB
MRTTVFRLAWSLLFLFGVSTAWAKDIRIEKRFDLAAGGALSLRTEAGGATVHGGNGSQALVVITSDRSDFNEVFNVRFDAKPSRLEVVIERKNKGFFNWFSGFRGRTHVDVELPRKASAEVHSSGGGVQVSNLQGPVKAKSSGGGVQVADIDADVEASSSGGAVRCERVHGKVTAGSSGGGVDVKAIGGAADLESSGGSVVAEDVGGDVRASSSGGGVRVQEARGSVEAGSSGGSVKVSFAAGNSRGGRVHSSGGGVAVQVDPGVGLEIDARSSGGSVSSDLPVTVRGKISRSSLHGKLNGGGAILEVHSSGGGVTLAPR